MSISSKVKFLNFFRTVFKLPVLEEWLKNRTTGKSPDHFFSKFVPNAYQYPARSLRYIERDGLKLEIDIGDYVGHYLYFGFEEIGFDRLFSLCKKDSHVIDVGANIGWTLLNLAKIAQEGRAVGFEPDPYNYKECQKNLGLSKLNTVQLLNIGLGTAAATMMMEIRTPSNKGGNRISPESSAGSVTVSIDRLDQIKVIQAWPRIDLIKIDVEGYELHVLQGAGSLLTTFKPTLFIELDDNNLRDQGNSAKLLIAFLETAGYQNIRHADTDQKVTSETDFTNCHFDIVVW